jgi:hypothetical protein
MVNILRIIIIAVCDYAQGESECKENLMLKRRIYSLITDEKTGKALPKQRT